MSIRKRFTIVLAASLLATGVLTIALNTLALTHASPPLASFGGELLDELGLPRADVIRHLREHPEDFFDTGGTTRVEEGGKTIDEAWQDVQRRNLDRAVERARLWAFLGMLGVAAGALTIGWLFAGQILRPIRAMTGRARAASPGDVGTRLALAGPDDEVKELADTFDDMLDRLAGAFDAQRRFSAQVAHELRTPLATTQAEVEMLLSDVEDPELRDRLERIAGATGSAERLVSRLWVLSRTDNRDLDVGEFALDELVGNVLGRAVEDDAWQHVRVDLDARSTAVSADRVLIESAVRNLLDNAAQHNRKGGWVAVKVHPSGDDTAAVLEVANSRPQTPVASPTHAPGAAHTGLSIVEAVVAAHGGTLAWDTRPEEVHATLVLAVPASALR